MINLNIQIKLLIFSFIYGFLLSIVLDFFYNLLYNIHKFYSIIISFFVILVMTIIYFVGIKQIGNIIFHFYSILAIIVGFVMYDLIIKMIANNHKK